MTEAHKTAIFLAILLALGFGIFLGEAITTVWYENHGCKLVVQP